jgi:hypothetical protein
MEAVGSSETFFFFARIGGDTFQNLSSLPSIKSLPLDPIKWQIKQIHYSYPAPETSIPSKPFQRFHPRQRM